MLGGSAVQEARIIQGGIQALANAGTVAQAELVTISRIGMANYCNINWQTCLVAVDAVVAVASGAPMSGVFIPLGISGKVAGGVAGEAKVGSLLLGGKGIDPALISEMTANGIKFTPENVIAAVRSSSGQIVFLETGSSNAGLQHILERHAVDFANKGISESCTGRAARNTGGECKVNSISCWRTY